MKKRSSNFELLRVTAMLMIVVYHIICHCITVQMAGGDRAVLIANAAFNHPAFFKKMLFFDTMTLLGPTANGIFFLISGYFLVPKGSGIDLFRIAKKLLLQLAFATVLLTVGSTAVFLLDGANHYYDLYSFTYFNYSSWFIGYYYLVVLAAALFLNRFLLQGGPQRYAVLLMVLFALTQFDHSGRVLDSLCLGLRAFLTSVFLYALGGYVRLYDPFQKVRGYVLVLLPAVTAALICLSSYNRTQSQLSYYFLRTPDLPYTQSYFTYSDYHVAAVLFAICLFELFHRIKMPQSSVINFLGSGTFMVYLLHDNSFFYSIWGRIDWIAHLMDAPLRFLSELALWSIGTFAVGILAYALYRGLARLVPAVSWLFVKKDAAPAETPHC